MSFLFEDSLFSTNVWFFLNIWFVFLKKYIQISSRKNIESTVRQLEREKALLQHKNTEYQRKAEHEADKKRNLENEGTLNHA